MDYFIEVDYSQFFKKNQKIGGDVFLLSRNKSEDQIICTLSDGLGSGVKANVLANLTAHMAQKFAFSTIDIIKSAEIIMNTLPVCKERKISYSTFSILKIHYRNGSPLRASIIEYDNPSFLLLRDGECLEVNKTVHELQRAGAFKEEVLYHTEVNLEVGDRILLYTDGVTQAGLGTKPYPLGWRENNVKAFVKNLMKEKPDLSAYELASAITIKAKALDIYKAKDDITCSSIYIRKPRRLLISTGPPINEENDTVLVDKINNFEGMKIISGGTTAMIYSRINKTKIHVNIEDFDNILPPSASVEGIDLVTEGMLTLNNIVQLLEKRTPLTELPSNAAGKFMKLLLSSDQVHFLVGTKINEAHQDSSIPFEIGIRRSIIRRIRTALEDNYLKETTLEFI